MLGIPELSTTLKFCLGLNLIWNTFSGSFQYLKTTRKPLCVIPQISEVDGPSRSVVART